MCVCFRVSVEYSIRCVGVVKSSCQVVEPWTGLCRLGCMLLAHCQGLKIVVSYKIT